MAALNYLMLFIGSIMQFNVIQWQYDAIGCYLMAPLCNLCYSMAELCNWMLFNDSIMQLYTIQWQYYAIGYYLMAVLCIRLLFNGSILQLDAI